MDTGLHEKYYDNTSQSARAMGKRTDIHPSICRIYDAIVSVDRIGKVTENDDIGY
jgi:hypothetical protein